MRCQRAAGTTPRLAVFLGRIKGFPLLPPGIAGDWQVFLGELRPRSILKAGRHLWIEGVQDNQAKLHVLSASDGQTVQAINLDVPMVWDGMSAADQCLFLSLQNGSIAYFGEEDSDRRRSRQLERTTP